MLFRTMTVSALASALILSATVALAADKDQTQDKTRDQLQTKDQTKDQTRDRTQDQTQLRDQDQIYGSQIMTAQERTEHRNKMRSLKTVEEREAYRLEHHNLMQERAKARGVTLPDEPPARGGMMRPGGGMGGGMGPGGRR